MTERKVALVLAGGGVTGIAFELGVLRALNEAWLNRGAEDLDLYVGTSAGSYIAAYLASGIPVGRLSRLLKDEQRLSGIGSPLATFFPNVGEVVEKGLFWPLTLLHASGALLKSRDPIKGVARAVEEIMPTGLFDTWLLRQALYRNFRRLGAGNHFAGLPKELHIIATDLDSGRRMVFNRAHPAPLDRAVAASCAIPLFYRPVRIHGRDYVDGGLHGTAAVELAVEQGASLVIVVNSLVPYANHPRMAALDYENGAPEGHISDRGLVAISNQVTRAAIHGGLLQRIRTVKENHPEVQVMLIEPSVYDSHLSFRNIMSYWRLNDVAHHGFRVGLDFWHRHEERARPILAAHGIELATRIQHAV